MKIAGSIVTVFAVEDGWLFHGDAVDIFKIDAFVPKGIIVVAYQDGIIIYFHKIVTVYHVVAHRRIPFHCHTFMLQHAIFGERVL